MSDQAHLRIGEIPIARLRRDYAMVVRGMLILSIVPAMALIISVMHELRTVPKFEIGVFFTWRVWLPLIFTTLIVVALRRLTRHLDRTALLTMLCGYAVIAITLVVALVWALSSIHSPTSWPAVSSGRIAILELLLALSLVFALALFLMWYAMIGPLRSAWRLWSARLPDGRGVIDTMNGVAAASANITAPKPSHSARAARVTCFAVAGAVGIFMIISVVWLMAKEQYLYALALEFALLAVLFALIRLGNRIAAVDAKTLLATDDRRPVLFLRSFQDDPGQLDGEWGAVLDVPDLVAEAPAGRLTSRALDTSAVRSLGSLGVPRLEEVIAAEVNRLGPFVAIGAPDELLPRLGAARDYYDGDTWQNAIQRWIDMAQLIVKVAGPTKWIRWELGHIIRQGAVTRLIVLFPKKETTDDRSQRWCNMAVCFDDTPWHEALSAIDPQHVMALRFKPGGNIEVITRGAHRGLDVTLAMRILLDGIIRDGTLPLVGVSDP